MSSRFIHVVPTGRISLFFKAEYFIGYICYIFFIHSSVNRHLGCFHTLAAVNSPTICPVCPPASFSSLPAFYYLLLSLPFSLTSTKYQWTLKLFQVRKTAPGAFAQCFDKQSGSVVILCMAFSAF